MKIESTNIDVFNSKNWNICCCGSEKCALSHGVGVSQGPVHDCSVFTTLTYVFLFSVVAKLCFISYYENLLASMQGFDSRRGKIILFKSDLVH